jgi:cytochrome c biogenesis protein CcmG/thiol:disulfide interchange protein DsbE
MFVGSDDSRMEGGLDVATASIKQVSDFGQSVAAAMMMQQATMGEGEAEESPVEAIRGQAAPDFTLPSLRGTDVTLSELRGKVVILDFWATWCPPCKAEIPGFIELQDRFRDRGLVIVGVSDEDRGIIAKFADENGVNYRMLYRDPENETDLPSPYSEIVSIPTTFVIDRSGKVVHVHVGFTSKEQFEKEILDLL